MGLPYPYPTSEVASRIMRANRKVGTRPEVCLRSELHRRGMRFRKDLTIEAGGLRVKPDVTFPRRRVAAFLDGCFWHRCAAHRSVPVSNADYWGPKLQRNVDRDRRVDAALMSAGWTVVRVWEHELSAGVDLIAARIEDALAST
jgi:DNA mismatch endonuclease, patch repair protein